MSGSLTDIKLSMKKIIIRTLRKKGYEIRKAPSSSFNPMPIFDLAVNYLITKSSENLSFIQVGANDGVFGDPLRKYILKYEWNGVFIEPQPEIYKELLINYKGLKKKLYFENLAISNNSESISLFRPFIGEGEINGSKSVIEKSSIASVNPTITARQFGVRESDLEEIKVATITLDEIVKKYQLSKLDILQIDTEGYDWEVLKTLNLKQTRPYIIQFEHGHMNPNIIDEISCHLRDNQYLLYFGGHESDSVAIRSDLIEL